MKSINEWHDWYVKGGGEKSCERRGGLRELIRAIQVDALQSKDDNSDTNNQISIIIKIPNSKKDRQA